MNLLSKLVVGAAALFAALPRFAAAHCPLCVGAVGGAVAASSAFGVNPAAVGVFVGAFGIVSGQWLANYIKGKRLADLIPFQSILIVLASFALTLGFAIPAVQAQSEVFMPVLLAGEPGGLLNRVYWLNALALGGVVGGVVTLGAHAFHNYIKASRGRVLFPFQSIVFTVGLVSAAAGAVQLLVGG